MYRLLIFTLLVAVSIEKRPKTYRHMCRPGDTHAVTTNSDFFRCKPGPAKHPYCLKFPRRNIAKPFVCPKNGYYNGWVTTPPFVRVEICCFEPGLVRKDCIRYETIYGQPQPVKSDRVLVGGYSKNFGKTWIRLECRYLGYPRASHNVHY